MEATEGRILVDGRDIAQVGLTDLRSRLTIIPRELCQADPVAFPSHFIRGPYDPEREFAVNPRRL